jgi:hypothetical protein
MSWKVEQPEEISSSLQGWRDLTTVGVPQPYWGNYPRGAVRDWTLVASRPQQGNTRRC